jgi:outer membrane protein assembly factor BamB
VEWLRKLYSTIIDDYRRTGKPLIPPAVPTVFGKQLVYVNDKSVAVLALTPDKSFDPPIESGEMLWAHELDFFDRLREPGGRFILDQWLKRDQSSLVAHRTLTGALGGSVGHVWFVDDVPVLPPPGVLDRLDEVQVEKATGMFADGVLGNSLKVVNVETGKLWVKLPRKSIVFMPRIDPATGKPVMQRAADSAPFGGNVYLGAPLPVDQFAVFVHEKKGRLHATCLSWDKVIRATQADRGELSNATLAAANTTFRWDTELVTAPTSVVADPHRRTHAIHLTKAGDLVVCPTHLGRVVAVEAKTGKVLWTHEYAPLDAKRFPTFAPEWVVVPPAVVGDRYVYAPADFPELLCLNVADGKKAWSVKKGDGQYPAVVGEQVLVVGEKAIRSLSLKDGSEQWKADLPGLPCGRGAVLGDTYMVPVSEPKTWKGLIAVVDLKAGKVAEVLRPEKDEPIGNLVVHQDFLISQTLTEIAVFPIKKKE